MSLILSAFSAIRRLFRHPPLCNRHSPARACTCLQVRPPHLASPPGGGEAQVRDDASSSPLRHAPLPLQGERWGEGAVRAEEYRVGAPAGRAEEVVPAPRARTCCAQQIAGECQPFVEGDPERVVGDDRLRPARSGTARRRARRGRCRTAGRTRRVRRRSWHRDTRGWSAWCTRCSDGVLNTYSSQPSLGSSRCAARTGKAGSATGSRTRPPARSPARSAARRTAPCPSSRPVTPMR